MHEALAPQVQAVLTDSADFDEVWDRLTQALDQQPGNAELLRLRIRLAEAAGLRREQLADLHRLAQLEPDNAQLQLHRAAMQHRWAHLNVDDEGEAAEQETQGLQVQAAQWFQELAAQHVQDPEFMHAWFQAWDEAYVGDLWQRLRWALLACAASPAVQRLQRNLAVNWCRLASQAPAGHADDAPPPMGFLVDAFGSLYDALMMQRSLQALQPLLAAAPDDVDLLELRASLLAACGKTKQAAADHLARAATLEQLHDGAVDEDDRAALAERAEQARTEARRCAAGREAMVAESMADMEGAVQGLGQLSPANRAHQPLSEEDQAARAEMQASSAQTRESLLGQLAQWAPQLQALAAGPNAEQRAAFDALAERVAARMPGLLAFEPSQWLALRERDLQAPVHEFLLATGQTLQALGWRHLAWCENPAYRKMFGQQVVTGLWVDAAGTSLAAAAAVKAIRLVDLETEFSDGVQFVTTGSRGRSNFSGGPQIDQLAVDPDVPLESLAELHRARVALRLALHPGQTALVTADVPSFAAMQERQRVAKMAFRLGEGLSEFEALGVPNDFPDYFVPRLQEAARRVIAGVVAGRA